MAFHLDEGEVFASFEDVELRDLRLLVDLLGLEFGAISFPKAGCFLASGFEEKAVENFGLIETCGIRAEECFGR